MNLLQQFVNFLASQKDKSSFSTSKNYKADVRQFINWFEKEFNSLFDPSKITLQILEQYKKTRNLAPISIQRHVSSLRKFFKFLKEKGLINFDLFYTQSHKKKIEPDPWMIRNFKSYLYEYKKSNLTIKNYINDVKGFFVWLTEVSLTKYAWNVTERNLLDKINFLLVDEYKQRLIAAKFSPRTINRKLSSLRNYITWAKSQGLISENSEPSRTWSEYSGNQNVRPSDSLSIPNIPSIPNENSKFPPVRLMRKSIKGINLLLDALFILPLAKSIENTQYLFWKVSGKRIFTKSSVNSPLITPVSNIQKEFYAPLNVSTRYLPVHKRVWHYLRHVRPNWYKRYHSYSIMHYFHFAILIILASGIGFGAYNGLFADAQKENAILGAVTSAPPRILSFQGKLTDSQDNPIIKDANILFSIYNDENALWTSSIWQETNSIKPDSEGTFSVLLGKNTPIPDTLFSQNSELFLGITVGNGPELRPRQQLATVPFASNTETLQGLEPITNTAKVQNVVLALDSGGNLSIAGAKAHTFQVIGGQFVLSGKVLSLTTVPGSNSNIEIVPDGMGEIDLSKPIHNSTNNNNLLSARGAVEFDDVVAILATTSAQSAFYINQNSTGPLISASTSGIAKFVVENDGTGMFSGNLGINGSDLTSTAATFNLLNSTVTTLNFAGAATTLSVGATTGTITIRNASAVIQGNITLGDAATDTLTFTGRVAQDSDLIPIGTTGTNDLGSSSLPWDNAYIDNIYAVKLDIQDSQAATSAAQIFNTNTGTDADGLIIKLGFTGAGTATNFFTTFLNGNGLIQGMIKSNASSGVTYQTNGVADFAEYFKKDKDQTIEYGSVVCLKDNGLAVKCDSNSNRIIGVASERPAFLGGENLGDASIAVGLVGQVETFVSTLNGEIKAGDLLSASEIPGVSVKTTKAGQVIAKALENLSIVDESRVVGFYDPDNKEYRSKTNFPDIPIKPNIIRVAKIYALINVSWYDPDAYLAQNGDFIVSSTGSNGYSVSNSKNETLTNLGAFFEIVAANIRTGLINASEITANSLVVATDNIIVNGQNLKDYIVSTVGGQAGIISPIVRTDQLVTNIISPLSSDSLTIQLGTPSGSLIVENASGLDIARIDSDGNASFSGQLSASSVQTNDATVSGILRTNRILADSIEGLNSFIDIASYSGQFAYVQGLQADKAQFNQGLMVFGPTSLSDISIAGQLSIGGTMFVTENSIETLGTALSLQSLRQGGLSIMGGLVFIDTDGNLKAQGDVSILGKLAVNIISPLPTSDLIINNASGSGVLSVNQIGDVVASGSGTFSKLNFSLIRPVLAVSATEAIASSSAGVASINSYQNELTIKNALVTQDSLIYITPVGTPSAQAPFLMRQLPSEFTVGVESPTSKPIPFNWLIIN